MKTACVALASLLAAGIPLLLGCSGDTASFTDGAGSPVDTTPDVRTGGFTISVVWPEASCRLVPQACSSIHVVVRAKGATADLVNPFNLSRTSPTKTVTGIRAGTIVVFTATAHPEQSGGGVSQAQGTAEALIISGSNTNVTLTMASTVASVSVTPSSTSTYAGGTAEFTATALDSGGNVVLTGDTWEWSSGSAAVATVSGTGATATVSAVGAGQCTITARETESGRSASAALTVDSDLYGDTSPTSIVETGPWQSACEVRGVDLDGTVLDAIHTNAALESALTGLVRTPTYVKYTTAYKDDVYFTLPSGDLGARVLCVSRLPVYNVGMIQRLDEALKVAATLYDQSTTDKRSQTYNILAGRTGRFYYTQEAGRHCRVYLETAGSGYLVVPDGSRALRAGGAAVGPWYDIELDWWVKVAGETVVDHESEYYMNFVLAYTGALSSGTYAVDWSWGPYGWGHPCSVRGYWLECAGETMTDPVTANPEGSAQPYIQSRAISELALPE